MIYEYIHEHGIGSRYMKINPYGSHKSVFTVLSHLSKNTFSYLRLEVLANCKGLSNIHHMETYFPKLMKRSYLYLYENNDFVHLMYSPILGPSNFPVKCILLVTTSKIELGF